MTTGKSDTMVPVNVLVPREMKQELDALAKARRWSLAVTVRYAIETMLEIERPPHSRPPARGRS
jgi:hypothetical protein